MKCITVVVIHAVIILLGAYCDIDPPSSSSPSELVILSNDFESGIGDDWEEKSPHPLDICWRVENDTNSDGADVPQPISGGNVLRTFKSSRYGSLVLLKSPMVEIVSGDQFSFSFWIHSHMEGTNNLEIFWVVDEKEVLLMSGLWRYSSPSNNEWRTTTFTLTPPSNERSPFRTQFLIYGYCGNRQADSIAVDDVLITRSITHSTYHQSTSSSTPTDFTASTVSITSSSWSSSSTSWSSSTSSSISTTKLLTDTITSTSSATITSPPSGVDCPESIPIPLAASPEYLEVPCWILRNGRCYCIDTKYAVDGVLVDQTPARFIESNDVCLKSNMTSVTLETEEENDIIKEHLRQNPDLFDGYFWTAGQYNDVKEEFVWAIGKQALQKPLTYYDWEPGAPSIQPLNGAVHVTVSSRSDNDIVGGWRDYMGEEIVAYTLCELQTS